MKSKTKQLFDSLKIGKKYYFIIPQYKLKTSKGGLLPEVIEAQITYKDYQWNNSISLTLKYKNKKIHYYTSNALKEISSDKEPLLRSCKRQLSLHKSYFKRGLKAIDATMERLAKL